jgi:hypothetical protein
MTYQNKPYFYTLFVPGYTVTAADMNDLVYSSFFIGQDAAVDYLGRLYFFYWPVGSSVDLHSQNLIAFSKYLSGNYSTLNFSDNQLTSCDFDGPISNLTNLNLSNNALDAAAIEDLLTTLASATIPVVVNLSGGTNAAHSTWSAPALAAEVTIIANGGSVLTNP